MGPMMANNRVVAHDTALQTIRTEQSKNSFQIKLPFAVDPYFCSRDDYGRNGRAEGITIGIYHHESPDYQQANQYVWILDV